MEPNMNNTNNNNSRVRPVRAPGFANGGVGGGDTADVVTPVNGGNDVVFQDKPKKNHGMLYGMILLAILAAGGIGFGVWAMMDGNSRVAKKDEQITDLNSQLAEATQSVMEVGTTVVDVESDSALSNPVITAVSPAEYKVSHSLPVTIDGSNSTTLEITVTDGSNPVCSFLNLPNGGDCSISGLPDGVYKIVTINEGQGVGYEKIGFLMSDGSVWFAPIYSSLESVNANRELMVRKANIDGFVKDIVNIVYIPDVNSQVGGGVSTMFVMSDNSIVKYDDSMFQQ